MSGPRRRVGVAPHEETVVVDDTAGWTGSHSGSPIDSQLRLIESSKATERTQGIQQLAEVLREDGNGTHALAESLSSSTWEQVITWTARILIKESQTYVNRHGGEWPQMSTGAGRMSSKIHTQYSGYIRHIWIAAMPHLPEKLARFLTKHMVEAIQENPCLIGVLGADYAKVLRAWAAHEPHVLNCREGRAGAIVDMCIQWLLSRTSTATESQMSVDSVTDQGVVPGDVEFAAVLLAIVTTASPARLVSLETKVLDFCVEYGRFYTRENSCHAPILDAANAILLATADEQAVGHLERTKSLLSSCLQLWPTRSPHTKTSVLYSIRILVRLVATALDDASDTEVQPLLELTLKYLTTGAWDKVRFMSLPSSLLSTWPLVRCGGPRHGTNVDRPLHQRLTNLWPLLEPNQAAFFDTVAFLAAALTMRSVKADTGRSGHRKKRSRSAPTPLARLLASIGSDDSVADACGAAQVVWFIANFYADNIGAAQWQEALQDIRALVQNSDISQSGELTEWVLAIFYSLAHYDTRGPEQVATTYTATDHIWRHAIAGLGSGLAGAAALVFYLLHRSGGSSADVCLLCQQAVEALAASPNKHGADIIQLSLLLAQNTRTSKQLSSSESAAKTFSQAVLQLCQYAGKSRWSLDLFSKAVSQALAFSDLRSQLDAPYGERATGTSRLCSFGPGWVTEMRFLHVMQVLDALSGNAAMYRCLATKRVNCNTESKTSSVELSSLSIAQWNLVAQQLLKGVGQCSEHEHSHPMEEALPYIAHALWLISHHIASVEQAALHFDADSEPLLAAQIASDLSERLLTFISDSKNPALVWRTLTFVHMWPESFHQLAGLESLVNWLLAALFDSDHTGVLYKLAWGGPGIYASATALTGLTNQQALPATSSAENGARHSVVSKDESHRSARDLEAHMLSTSVGLVHAPWRPIVATLSALVERRAELGQELAARLDGLIEAADDVSLLVAGELIARCAMIVAQPSKESLSSRLLKRVLKLLDSYDHTGHMPALFGVMQAVYALILQSPGTELGRSEDLPRFVAWLAMETHASHIDPFLEVHFARLIVGPWGRRECDALVSVLSIVDTSAADLLAHRAQGATNFVVRLAAEEQLALCGLRLPYLRSNGSLAYPDAPQTEARDTLVFITRDIGLALLVANSGYIIPGALCILLRQVDPRNGCSLIVVEACQRLLARIAANSNFSSVGCMIAKCATDIFCVNPELLDAVIEYLGSQLTPELDLQLRLDAALEWMLRGELESALSAMPKPATGAELATAIGSWPVNWFAHLLVLEASDPELFARIRHDILVPCLASERLTRLTKDTPELLIAHILTLCLPEKNMSLDIKQEIESGTDSANTRPISRAFQQLCEPLLGSRVLPQWGRCYTRQSISRAVENVANSSCAVSTDEFLSSARIAWIVIQIQSQLQAAQCNEQKQKLGRALCLLIGLALPDILDSPLVQLVLVRALVDLWRRRCEYACLLACLATGLLLDNSISSVASALISTIGTGLLDVVAADDVGDRPSLWPLTSLLQAVADSGDSILLDDSRKLFIGSDLEALYDWARLPTLVITRDIVRQSEDRVGLAGIADWAAKLLGTASNSVACAEILVESLERLLQLALPLSSESTDPSPPDAVASEPLTQIDLAANIVAVLLRVQRSVRGLIRGTHSTRRANSRVAALLLRAISLLQVVEPPSDGSAADIDDSKAQLLLEGDLSWLVSDVVTRSSSQGAVIAAISVAARLRDTLSSANSSVASSEATNALDGKQSWIFRDVTLMPVVTVDARRYPRWLRSLEGPPRLDYSLLESLCASGKSPSDAFSELVCALASHKECTKAKLAMPLILADSCVASCLLPHILLEILPTAGSSTRMEIAAFLLDFVHNWRDRAPGMARDVITRTLDTRQLDQQYSDIREFFERLPMALFEMADLAAKLGMPETAAFLLECDLTCTGDERLADISDISNEARELLRVVNKKLGNQPAALLLSSVSNIDDILRRCRDTADWRTLLLYQEAAGSSQQHQQGSQFASDEFEIGDTLVSLGLLNAMRPTSFGDGGIKPSSLDSAPTFNSQAAYGASWRLAKWDVPAVPLVRSTSGPGLSMLSSPVDRPEEALYSLLRLRSNGQLVEAASSAQEFMASASAVAAITEPASSLRDAWSYRAVGMLLPLFSARTCQAQSLQEFLHTSQIVSALLARNRGAMPAEAVEPIYQVNLTLHEIAVSEASVRGSVGRDADSIFSRYKEAVRLACVTARQARNWQSSMNHIFRLRAMAKSVGYLNNTLEPELRLWEAETLWEAGNRALAIEVLQSHKCEMEHTLQQARMDLSSGSLDGAAMIVSPAATQLTPATQHWTRNELEATTILMSRIILTVGEWSDQQRRERPAVLWAEYFNKSAVLLQEINSPTAWTGRALYALAAFAERQCVELTSTRDDDSTAAVRKQKARELAACQQEIARTSSTTEAQRLRGILRRLEIQVSNDQKELDELRSSIGGFLRMAIWSFVKCLGCTDAFDNCVYSLISLIMTNARAQELQRALTSGAMDDVPSHKFLLLVHQLCARLSTEEDAFHRTITQLVTRMAVQYPYHTMYHLFALRNANRALSSSSSGKISRKGSLSALQMQESEKMEERRSEAATAILTSVSSQSPDLRSIAQAINELCTSYIDLAVCPVPDKFKNSKAGDGLVPFSSRARISKLIKDLPPNIPVLTATPRADAPCDYMCVPFVSSIAAGYSLAGGINLPKILRLVGTDGKRYKQLVKGKDDLRQDAIIQQLFHVINRFMRSSGAGSAGSTCLGSAATSSLCIRTYQVVPLTKRCGVLQWVDNTMPFGTWFQGRERRYRPNAPTMSQLRATIHDVHKDKEVTAQQKLEVFERVCRLAPPVFRFFFYEQFYNAQSWFEHRETYIRSAAVSSMAGWVLGIGDRHLQNILVDRATAELVHIDLGIAFDMGKLLPIPELIPFRLTREIIDGMGLLGLNGTFRHSCQAALQAMRDNAQVVITILNVLKVDPLYTWSLIPLRQDKMNRNVGMYVDEYRDHSRAAGDANGEENHLLDQDGTTAFAAEEENKEAERSIIHVGQRLSATISVEGQVSELIQQATDPGLLSRLFEGWSAWY
ncbi:Serine/threonine-protein kinase tel1 [Coemansia sp. RSA 2050]|nr:Serine/threonine-protein kinase tel1 [Coemansia sp. RSA 2050]KAJ2737005.1 Serine/threonine-protein kinase tel1 [Coemansia sp. BCRC 34962]